MKVTVQQSLLAIQSRNRKHSEYTDQLIHWETHEIGETNISFIFTLIFIFFDKGDDYGLYGKGKGTVSCQITNVHWDPSDIFNMDLVVDEGINKFVDDIEEVKHGWIGSVLWKFEQYVQLLDENESQKGQEEHDRQPLLTEFRKDEIFFWSYGIRTAHSVTEEEDYRVQLIDDQLDVDHTQHDQVKSSDEPKTPLPLAPQQPSDHRLRILILSRHVHHVYSARYERDQPRKGQDYRAGYQPCRPEEDGHGEGGPAHHSTEKAKDCRRRGI